MEHIKQDTFTTCYKTCGPGSLLEGLKGLVQSPFDAKAVETVTLRTMHACTAQCAKQKQNRTGTAINCNKTNLERMWHEDKK